MISQAQPFLPAWMICYPKEKDAFLAYEDK